jgi:chromosome segregation ATPase
MSKIPLRQSILRPITIRRSLSALAIAAGLSLVAPLQAQQQGAPQGGAPQAMTPEQSEKLQAFQKVRAEFMAAQQRLDQIQQETMKAHPELEKQEQALKDMVTAKMKKNGNDPDQDLAEIDKLQEQLRSDKTPEEERQALMGQLQEKAMAYRKAQGEALQDRGVKKAQSDLMVAVVDAMKNQDPESEKLIEQMKQKRQELMQMLEAAGQAQK